MNQVQPVVPSSAPILVIGIAGGSGSGKTTFAHSLLSLLQQQKVRTSLLTMDFYYKDLSHLPTVEERSRTNFDHPDSIETSLLIRHISELKQNRTVHIPVYDFSTHSRKSEVTELIPPQVLIVEGILLFSSQQELTSLLDIKCFIDCNESLRFIRRLNRDVKERARDVESVCMQFLQTVQPMHDLFVQPSKEVADVVVPNNKDASSNFDVLLDLLCCKAMNFALKHSLVSNTSSPCSEEDCASLSSASHEDFTSKKKLRTTH